MDEDFVGLLGEDWSYAMATMNGRSLGAIVLVHKLAAMVAPEDYIRWIRPLLIPSLLHLLVAHDLCM